MKNNVILIGFMGAGKTCIGTRYARMHHMQFLDTDHLIEKQAGMTVNEIFAIKGEEAFRQFETSVLRDLLEYAENSVISVGGGLPLREENRELLKRLGHVVLLEIEADTVLHRLANDTTRPMLQGYDRKERIKLLLEERMPIYRKAANIYIYTEHKRVVEIINEVEEKVGIES